MLDTRGVLAIMTGVTMLVALVTLRSGRKSLGLWLLTAGFGLATIWSGLSVYWAQENPDVVPWKTHLVLGTTAVAGTIYYGMLAKEASGERA